MARKAGTTATMWQVAERAGVSQATVSLVLNNIGGSRVNEVTRERVMEPCASSGIGPTRSPNLCAAASRA